MDDFEPGALPRERGTGKFNPYPPDGVLRYERRVTADEVGELCRELTAKKAQRKADHYNAVNARKGLRSVEYDVVKRNWTIFGRWAVVGFQALMVPVYTTGTGQIVGQIHSPEKCAGRACVIHNPSDHHMRGWPTHWRDDRGIMERICPHGIGHPDPDDITTDTVHGCDGCCTPPTTPEAT